MSNKVYGIVNDKVIDGLEQGLIAWHEPWPTGRQPINYATGRHYSGVNALLINLQGGLYRSPYWATWRQIDGKIGSVKKKQRGSLLIWWQQRKAKSGRSYPVLRYFRVWNLEQLELFEPPPYEAPASSDPVAVCASLVESMSARPRIVPGSEHRYDPTSGLLSVPPYSSMEPDLYYCRLYRELAIYAAPKVLTKAAIPSLQRDLTAEITAGLLCATAGIPNRNTEPDPLHWIEYLRNDDTAFVLAACAAKRAVRYLVASGAAASLPDVA